VLDGLDVARNCSRGDVRSWARWCLHRLARSVSRLDCPQPVSSLPQGLDLACAVETPACSLG
jgi:hypothetical protein